MSAASSWSAASVLSSPTALPHTLQSLLKALGNNFPADGIFVNTYYSETKEVHFLAHATHQSAQEIYDIVPLDRNKKSNAQTPSQDPVYRVDNIETDPFTHAVATQVIADIQSYVMVRLRLEGRHLGVACFYSRRPAAFNDAHVRQIEELRDLLYYDRARGKAFAVGRQRKGVKEAVLLYRVIRTRPHPETGRPLTLASVRPLTGRTHQIRVQFASRRLPLLGDRRYGGSGDTGISLWCRSITLPAHNGAPQRTYALDPTGAPWDWLR